MTEQQWVPISRRIQSAFRGDFGAAEARDYFHFLRTYSAAEIDGALQLLVQRGQVFVPSAGEVAVLANELRGIAAPTWEEALDQLQRAIRHFGRDRGDDAVQGLYGRHPFFGLFAQQHGWRLLCNEAIDDPDVGHAVRRRLQDSWDRLCEAQLERIQAGQAVAALKAATGLELAGGPRVIDPLRHLGRGPSDAEENVSAA